MRTKWGFVLVCVGLVLLITVVATNSGAQTQGDKMKPEKDDKVKGSGTAGFLAKFLSADTIGDSVVFESDSGNIGIGFSVPERKFEVFGTAGFHYGTTENGSSVVWINQMGDPPEGGFNVGLHVTTGGNEETGESIAIWGSSNSPNASFGVQGTGRVGVFGDSHLEYGVGIGAYASSFSGETRGVQGVVESSDGTAGQFENNAGGTILRGFGAGHTEVFHVAGDGTVTAVDFVETSSIESKKDIATLQRALDTVQKLRGVSYSRKSDGRHSIGLIAEEVSLLIPEVVDLDAGGEPRGLNYGRLTALLIEAIKDQQHRFEISNLR